MDLKRLLALARKCNSNEQRLVDIDTAVKVQANKAQARKEQSRRCNLFKLELECQVSQQHSKTAAGQIGRQWKVPAHRGVDLTKSQRAGHARAEKAVADAIAAAEAIFDAWTPLPTKSMDVDDKAEIGVKVNDVEEWFPEVTAERHESFTGQGQECRWQGRTRSLDRHCQSQFFENASMLVQSVPLDASSRDCVVTAL